MVCPTDRYSRIPNSSRIRSPTKNIVVVTAVSTDSCACRRRPEVRLEDGRGIWTHVRGADGAILAFAREDEARAKLAELYPVLVQMEK